MKKLVAIVLLAAGCLPAPIPTPGLVPDAGAGCEPACANLARLGCSSAQGSPGSDEIYGTSDDVPCARVCADVEAEGIGLDTSCVARARTCDESELCAE